LGSSGHKQLYKAGSFGVRKQRSVLFAGQAEFGNGPALMTRKLVPELARDAFIEQGAQA
jgi:hypothetical protein